jgi:hypothetical protein
MREIRTSGSTRGGAPMGPLLLYRLGTIGSVQSALGTIGPVQSTYNTFERA